LGNILGDFFTSPSGHPVSARCYSIHLQLQGCQIVCFQTKNPNLGKFMRALEWEMLVYFMALWNIFLYILWSFGNVVVVWRISPRFGKLCQEKSGNLVQLGMR
jgi:hypothetical protein